MCARLSLHQVAKILSELSRCLRDSGRTGEAIDFSRQALDIKERRIAKGDGVADPQFAAMLYELGLCLREEGRAEESERYVRRALKIVETTRGPESAQVEPLAFMSA